MENTLKHIAIIMDGNGRWAQSRGLPRSEGHRRGAQTVRKIVEEACRIGLPCLTLYCFSHENWKRPPDELAALMFLLEQFMVSERETMVRENIRLKVLGRREGIPESALREMDETLRVTAGNTGLMLCLAINYGSRQEMTDMVRSIAHEVREGTLAPDAITEQTIQNHLYTSGLPDPDLLIRTAGELRLSNYLLWQLSYAEIWVTSKCWPDFDVADFHAAMENFQQRTRRFGAVTS
ncbi:MAG: isoprenyl transferase [Planctomycetia bacterium]|nr:isoprenyl transferase [Planctomycetia bacterium]